jgi:predicted nucleic acid-binding Zn ribbon protein
MCCGEPRDILQKLTAPAPACAICTKPMAKQVTSPGGFNLKGGGFDKNGFSK